MLILNGCGGIRQPSLPVNFAAYQSFIIPRPLLPLRAKGSLYLKMGKKGESGNFILTTTREGDFRIQLKARFTGSLVLEIRFNENTLLLLNYVEKTYFLGSNSPANRRKLFGLDLTPAEFIMILTGRISKPEFDAGQGVVKDEKLAVMPAGQSQYRFILNSHGLPSNWTKEQDAKVIFRVEYRAYLLLPFPSGDTVRLPYKIRVFARDENPVMILGVQDFSPGEEEENGINLEAPVKDGWKFQELPDPNMDAFRTMQ